VMTDARVQRHGGTNPEFRTVRRSIPQPTLFGTVLVNAKVLAGAVVAFTGWMPAVLALIRAPGRVECAESRALGPKSHLRW
jgi:hypothetical protein